MSDPPKKPGLSLYADLLGGDKPNAPGATISSAPVKYDMKKAEEEDAQKKKDASLKFQPIRRPQVPTTSKSKPPPSSSIHQFSSSTATASANSPDKQEPPGIPQQTSGLQKSNFEDWVGDEDDEFYYQNRPRQDRGSKKNKKKKKQEQTRIWDWDDIYDPTMPNNYSDYKGSEEQFREVRDWKARLYYHQIKEAKKLEEDRQAYSDEEKKPTKPANKMFAPPPSLSFAPPSFESDLRPPVPMDEDEDDYYPPDATEYHRGAPPSFAPSTIPQESTGEDAYMRRLRMGGMASGDDVPMANTPPMPASVAAAPAPPPPMPAETVEVSIEAKRAEAQAKIAAFKAKLQQRPAQPVKAPSPPAAPPPVAPVTVMPPSGVPPEELPIQPAEQATGQISRAPVRYEVQSPRSTMTLPHSESPTTDDQSADKPRSNRPGQKGFAERLMKKYGWEKGKGLGAQNEGITTALVGKAEKRKKLPDAAGGGWAAPKNMGKIVGGKKRQKLDNGEPSEGGEGGGEEGQLSSVVRMQGMLARMDVKREIEENNLLQEIGEEMGRDYGNVERVFVNQKEDGGDDDVFVKFVSELGALRAVRGMEGMIFAENEVKAGFFDAGKWERGELD